MRKEAELLWNARDKDRDILYHCRKSAIIKIEEIVVDAKTGENISWAAHKGEEG